MNTSKSLDELLADYYWACEYDGSGGYKTEAQAKAAIVEAVEGLVNRSKKHSLYENGKLESFILTRDLRKAIKEWQ